MSSVIIGSWLLPVESLITFMLNLWTCGSEQSVISVSLFNLKGLIYELKGAAAAGRMVESYILFTRTVPHSDVGYLEARSNTASAGGWDVPICPRMRHTFSSVFYKFGDCPPCFLADIGCD